MKNRGSIIISTFFVLISFCTNAQEIKLDAIKDVTVSCNNIPAAANVATEGLEMEEQIIKGKCEDNYSIIRTYRGKNKNGKTMTKVQKISVEDNDAPVVTNKLCDYIIRKGDEVPSIFVTGLPTAKDNCDAFLSMVFDEQVKVKKNQYEKITRTWKIMDNCGNFTNYTQTITVLENKNEATVTIK